MSIELDDGVEMPVEDADKGKITHGAYLRVYASEIYHTTHDDFYGGTRHTRVYEHPGEESEKLFMVSESMDSVFHDLLERSTVVPDADHNWVLHGSQNGMAVHALPEGNMRGNEPTEDWQRDGDFPNPGDDDFEEALDEVIEEQVEFLESMESQFIDQIMSEDGVPESEITDGWPIRMGADHLVHSVDDPTVIITDGVAFFFFQKDGVWYGAVEQPTMKINAYLDVPTSFGETPRTSKATQHGFWRVYEYSSGTMESVERHLWTIAEQMASLEERADLIHEREGNE